MLTCSHTLSSRSICRNLYMESSLLFLLSGSMPDQELSCLLFPPFGLKSKVLAPEPPLGAEGIAHLVSEFLPKHGIDPVQQVQVLCPTTRGEVGTRQLNSTLQQLLNP